MVPMITMRRKSLSSRPAQEAVLQAQVSDGNKVEAIAR